MAKSDVPAAERPAPKRRGRRWLWALTAVMLALAAAPTAVSKTPLRNVALGVLLQAASFDGQATIGSASLGWFSPIEVNDLEVRDSSGQVVVSLPAFSIDRTLFGLLCDRSDLGHARLERPVVELRLKERGSNVRDVAAEPIAEAHHEAAGVSADLEIVDGKVIVNDVANERDWTLGVSLAGSIANARTTRDVELKGSIHYDLAQLAPLLAARTAGNVTLIGEATEPFAVRGSLGNAAAEQPAWRNLSGDARIGWQAANAYGFEAGPARVDVRLAGGYLRLSTEAIDVSGGRLTLAPRVRLSAPQELEMDAGRIVDHVRVSPEMCKAWLKFALPVLADVTEVDGEFSIDMQGCRLPLANVVSAETAGTISVHAIELGPGPLAQQFLPVIEKLRNTLHIGGDRPPVDRLSIANESQVEFRMTEGRVYHRGLRLQFPQMTVETYGSVGLDESLALMAEISLPDKWLGKGPIGAMLKSQPLKLPIGGTLKEPKLDVQELRSLGRQTIRETAKGLLGEEIERGLNRLFKPRKE